MALGRDIPRAIRLRSHRVWRCVSGPLLSVVIPFVNDEATLPELLAAFANEEWVEPWELILCDNGSTDGSRAVIAAYAVSSEGTRELFSLGPFSCLRSAASPALRVAPASISSLPLWPGPLPPCAHTAELRRTMYQLEASVASLAPDCRS